MVASFAAWWQAPSASIAELGTVDSALYPIERSPADRLPIIRRELQGISVSADGQRAVAVGNYGTVLTSNNGGQSWTARTSGTNSWLYGISVSADGQRAVAVGSDGTILTSSNGGQSWTARTSGTNRWLIGISISADGQRAVAVGSGGTILTSNNGGQSWTARTNSTDEALIGISISADGQRAIAAGFGSTIFISSNGGQSWTAQTSGTNSRLSGISVSADGQRAVAVGEDGAILTSNNGGQSWTAQTSGTDRALTGISISADGQRAAAVGEYGTILTSNNDGQSWTPQTSGTDRALFGISVSADGLRAVATGQSGTILTSSNGRQSWTAQTSGRNSWLYGTSVSADGLRTVAAGQSGTILTNNNGGQSWTAQTSGTDKALTGISISADGQRAAAVGEGGIILTSNNSGQSWSLRTSGIKSSLSDISISADGQRAAAVGFGGTILTSSNGGQSWTAQTSGTNSWLFGISISADGLRAVAAGQSGTILTSNNGGQSWTARTSGTNSSLSRISVSADGQRAMAVGEDGTILTSNNGGQSWTARTSGTNSRLYGISISADGQRAVAVGSGGTILTSSNGGQSWTARTSGTNSSLYGISVSADGQRAVAAGGSGTILTSNNGGQSWAPPAGDYARFPAPWYWLALIISAVLLYRGFAGKTSPPQTGAAAMATSDAPALDIDQDRLDFAPLARGISRFLRNANTDPPLTLAITGEWGSGKSSLMGQVCADLKAYGWQPVWFNAWHHQNEEQLLAALLISVRETGVPPVATLRGLGFRLRLLLTRAQKNWIASLGLFTLASLIIAYVIKHPNASEWQGPFAVLKAISEGEWTAAAGAVPIVGGLGAIPILGSIFVLYAIVREMKTFGVDPAVLLASTVGKFRLKDASAQTSFRMRFAEQFGEVTAALANPMVIVIDDLDRCKPETVLDVMEAVNFLTSSGKCYVIFGMASERVLAALALSFKDIAPELVEFDANAEAASGDTETRERQRRQDYARQYLEKLINIEIKVPNRVDLPAAKLLEAPMPQVLDPITRFFVALRRWVPVFAVIGLGVYLAQILPAPWKQAQTTVAAVVTQDKGAKADTKVVPPPAKPMEIPTLDFREDLGPPLMPGDNSGISPLWFAGAFALLALLTGGLFVQWLRRRVLVVEDTQAFKDAISAWLPVATFSRNSPRAIKRFANRIRYLAMLQQGEQLDEMPMWTKIIEAADRQIVGLRLKLNWRRAKNETDRPTPKPVTEQARALSEHRVVALGAMHAHFGDKAWRAEVGNENYVDWIDELSDVPTGFGDRLSQAIRSYRMIAGASWPPSEEELDAFERSLKGVRLPGDGRTFDIRTDQKAPSSSSPQRKSSAPRKAAPRKGNRPPSSEVA